MAGEVCQVISFGYLACSLFWWKAANKPVALKTKQGLSPQTLLAFLLLHLLRLPAPFRLSRWNEAGNVVDISAFVCVCAAVAASMPLQMPPAPFGAEIFYRVLDLSPHGKLVHACSFALLICLSMLTGGVYTLLGGAALTSDDKEMGFGIWHSFGAQCHLALDGIVLLPQCWLLNQRYSGMSQETQAVPRTVANFLALQCCSRIFFSISGVGFFLWIWLWCVPTTNTVTTNHAMRPLHPSLLLQRTFPAHPAKRLTV